MRVLVFGAGAIGSLYGWALSEAGHEVRHWVRPQRVGPLEHGLAVDVLDGRGDRPQARLETYAPRLLTACDPQDPYDLMLIAVRPQELQAAAALAARDAGDTPLLFFGDLWNGMHDVDEVVSRTRYLWGYPSAGASMSNEDTQLTAALLAKVRVAEIDGSESARLLRIMSVFTAAGFQAQAQPAIEHWLQVRWAVTATLAGAALAAGGAQQLLADRAALRDAVLAVREGLLICERRGVDVRGFRDVMPFYMSGNTAARLQKLVLQRHAPLRRSLEIREGDPQLVRMFADLVTTGRGLGVDMPRLEALAQISAPES
jgi:2-dehydropantoate 2-reductase